MIESISKLVWYYCLAIIPVEGDTVAQIIYPKLSYDVPWRPQALVAAAFTRLYFEGRFFAKLEGNLRVWQGDITANETANREAEEYHNE